MKQRKLIYSAVLAAIVVLAVAVPVLAADGDVVMWVQRARLAWCGRSSGGTDRVVAKIHIFDANRSMVTGAAVTAVWTLPNTSEPVTQTAITDFQGIAEFTLWDGRGIYQICVDDVAMTGWEYVPALDREGCATIDV